MSLEEQLTAAAPAGPSVVTVGTFDGVHLGHVRLLTTTRNVARAKGASSVVVTFRRPPREVIRNEKPNDRLCRLKDRLELIRQTGVDRVIDVDFDESVRNLSAREFMQLLTRTLGMKCFVMGPGSAVGKDRTGGEGELRALGEELGFALEAIDPVIVDGVTVRSTAVRAALASGDVDVAATMLGRHFSLSGIVKEGDHRGAELGFPTANVVPPKEFALPADGVYATRVKVNGDEYPAATNLGVRPTFDGKTRLMEAYLLGYEGDLYGRRITVQFVRKLREETRFESADKLVEQMKRDVEDTRRILAEATAASG